MSYHDRLLLKAAKASRKRASGERVAAALRGINVITLNPNSPNLNIGSLQDDWLAVGNDMRNAMRQLDFCD